MLTDLTYLVVVVLVPIIPAFLLYKYLPEGKTTVGGPFRGLDIRLTGAFAGYFLVLLIASSLIVFLIKRRPPPNLYEVYTVSGKIDLRRSGLEPDKLGLSLMPPERTVGPAGHFRFEIPVKPGQSGQLEFPSMLVTYPQKDVAQETVPLQPGSKEYDLVFDHAAKTITIKSLLILERRPPNAGETQQPQPLTPLPSSQPREP